MIEKIVAFVGLWAWIFPKKTDTKAEKVRSTIRTAKLVGDNCKQQAEEIKDLAA